MKLTRIAEILKMEGDGREITVKGWVRTKRGNKNVAFIFGEENPQLKTIYIHPEATINTISCDDHVEVYLYDAEDHNDVNSGNWGDEDVDPWTTAA